MEFTGAVWIYTDNDDFFNGNTLEQDPLYTLQSHLIYTFRPGIWASGSLGYSRGGRSTVNGKNKHDLKENIGWAVSLGYPFTRRVGAKVAYIGTRVQQPTGLDTDTVAAAVSFYW